MSASPPHIEFEAPPSAITPAPTENRHYSIDLSLELERQLDMESLPPTPAPPRDPPTPQPHPQSLQMPLQMPDIDPHVLAHIIGELRHQLTDLSRERDDLLALLSAAHTKEAELKDALQHITDKAMDMDEALSEARRKTKDDEEAIKLLRTKVEESRRGLMRLQSESRRTVDCADDHRFVPREWAAVGVRRCPAILETRFVHPPHCVRLRTSPSRSHHCPTRLPGANVNRRMSGFFGRSSPPKEMNRTLTASPDEAEKLRKELQVQRGQGGVRDRTTSAGGHASDVKLPPLPAVTTGEETDGHAQKKAGWGFKLWKVDTAVKPAQGPPSASTSIGTASPIVPAAPLSRKLTGFFRLAREHLVDGLQTQNAQNAHHRDSVYSLSDASSLAEPISPTSQVNGGDVRVRDVNSSPEMSEGPEPGMKPAPPLADDDALSLREVAV
ncbi:hypothetical protein C8J57DRAFT_1463912 [Mycena rebaudengoi]|nr:hypothetical protein C8J57DRAFT_1463912 [Mycena rebaudengoi]